MYTTNKDGTFSVASRSGRLGSWIVSADIKSCNCPKFKFILKGQSPCHHMTEVLEGETTIDMAVDQEELGFKNFNAGEYPEPLSLYDFVEVYGESQYKTLTAVGEIMLIQRRVRVLK